MLAGVDYLAGDVLDRSGAATILFVCFVGPALLLTPLWARIGTRVGKKQGYVAASLILAAGAVPHPSRRPRQDAALAVDPDERLGLLGVDLLPAPDHVLGVVGAAVGLGALQQPLDELLASTVEHETASRR